VASDLDPRERGPGREEHHEDEPARGVEASMHVGWVDDPALPVSGESLGGECFIVDWERTADHRSCPRKVRTILAWVSLRRDAVD
jgi:hypothetical protein